MTHDLRPPFPWFGGKSRVAAEVWRRFGDVPNYVEPFAGSLAVLLARPHAPRVETVNDRDCYLANFWRALKHDPEGVASYAADPVNEADLHARHAWLIDTGAGRVERLLSDPDFYDVKVAGWWVWGLCAWIGSGWCDRAYRKLPHLGDEGRGVLRRPNKLPRLSDAGTGGERPSRQLPHLSDSGAGVHRRRDLPRQLPHVGDPGRGRHAPGRRDGLLSYLTALAGRLERVRVACGDWSRIVGPSVTIKHGTTAVFLDPPYDGHESRYSEANAVFRETAEWAADNGDDPALRIALCGYEGDFEPPPGWTTHTWKAAGGYGGQRQNGTNDNAARERVWFSPHCLPEHQPTLFEAAP